MEKVSVIVPVFNAAKCIGTCIESLQKQSYQELEILLVDDGSGDDSLLVMQSYQKEDKRIQIMTQSNQGVSASRNRGLIKAQGSYVLFVDADDTLDENAVEDNLKMAIANELDLVLFCFRYHIVDEDRIDSNHLDSSFVGSDLEFFQGHFEETLGRELLNPPWNKLIKKAVIDEHNLKFNPSFSICEDMAFSMEVLYHSKRIGLNSNAYYNYYLKSSGTLVFRFHENYFEALSYFYDNAMNYCNKFTDNSRQRALIDSLYVAQAIHYVKQISCKEDWSKDKINQFLEKIIFDPKFEKALNAADLNHKKRMVRILIRYRLIRLIQVSYRFMKHFEHRKKQGREKRKWITNLIK